MNCPNCNHPIHPNAKFCGVCGTPITPDMLSNEQTQAADEQAFAPQEPVSSAADEPQYGDSFTQQPNEPFVQPAQQYQPPAQPAQSQGDYSQQYQQYQQPSQFSASHASQVYCAPKQSKKPNTPLIIIIIVLAVLLIGGVVTTILLINGNKGGDSKPTVPATTVSQQSSMQSSQNSADETYAAEATAVPESTAEEQTSALDSSDTEQSSVTPYIGSNELQNNDGVVIADDPAVHADDVFSEIKLQAYIDANGGDEIAEALATDDYTAKIYAKGNALVYEMTLTGDLTDTQIEGLKSTVATLPASMSATVRQAQDESNVDDMVMVYAYIDKDGSLITSCICEG